MKVTKIDNLFATNFYDDIRRGKEGERIFEEDFLSFLDIKYENVTGCQQYQVIDADFRAKIGLHEVKLNYKDDQQLVIEEYTNIDPDRGPITPGWFFKSEADLMAFISKESRTIVLVPWHDRFKQHYLKVRENYTLVWNWPTRGRMGNMWTSAYRRIPLSALQGFYSQYKRVK